MEHIAAPYLQPIGFSRREAHVTAHNPWCVGAYMAVGLRLPSWHTYIAITALKAVPLVGARLQVTGTSCLDTVRIPWCICSVKLAVGSKCTIACTETYNTGSPPALAHVNCTPSCQSCATLRWGQIAGHWNFLLEFRSHPGVHSLQKNCSREETQYSMYPHS